MSRANFVVPVRADQQQVLHVRLREQILHQVQRCRIQPLQIVEEQGKRMFGPCEYTDESAKYLLKPVLCVPRGKFGNGRLFSDDEFQFWGLTPRAAVRSGLTPHEGHRATCSTLLRSYSIAGGSGLETLVPKASKGCRACIDRTCPMQKGRAPGPVLCGAH